jgi:antitoxin ParD1/3/4
MSGVEKVTIALTPEHAAMIKAAVESGRYGHTSEVIRDAMRLWEDREFIREKQQDELRRLIQEGIDSGPGGPFDAEDMWRRIEARALEKKHAA